jgi:hypothetical protein
MEDMSSSTSQVRFDTGHNSLSLLKLLLPSCRTPPRPRVWWNTLTASL